MKKAKRLRQDPWGLDNESRVQLLGYPDLARPHLWREANQ